MKKVVLAFFAFGLVLLSGAKSSAETIYQARARAIVGLYQTLLDRPSSAVSYAEVAYWVDFSFKQPLFPIAVVEREFLRSDERFVAQAYRNILRRVGDQGGIQYYTKKLRDKAMTRQQLVELFQKVCSQRINGECSK